MKSTLNKCISNGFVGLTLALSTSFVALSANDMNTVINKGVQRGDIAKENEKQISKIDEQLKSKQEKYSALLKENEGLSVYIKQLSKQIENQQLEAQKIEQAIIQSAQMERQVVPLMLRMLTSLEELVALDMPFKKAERTEKVVKLQGIIERSDVSVAEKYRKVLEMYQNEIDYGRTIEAYRDEIEIDGQIQQVDVLRIGRIALIYQSLDGKRIASWNPQSNSWEELDSAYKSKIQKAIRIAREQAAPELMKIPLTIPSV